MHTMLYRIKEHSPPSHSQDQTISDETRKEGESRHHQTRSCDQCRALKRKCDPADGINIAEGIASIPCKVGDTLLGKGRADSHHRDASVGDWNARIFGKAGNEVARTLRSPNCWMNKSVETRSWLTDTCRIGNYRGYQRGSRLIQVRWRTGLGISREDQGQDGWTHRDSIYRGTEGLSTNFSQ
jgi:hypothetical protein